MWELDKHFRKNEVKFYEGNPTWIGYWKGLIIGLILTFFLGIGIIILGLIALKRTSTKYAITDKRIIGRSGIISEDFKSITFKHVTSVGVRQGIIGKIFNFGNVIIDTAGSGHGVDFIWTYVKEPIKVKNMIEKHID